MDFEWDCTKAVRNQEKHGVSFEQAITAFDDPFSMMVIDHKHSTVSETREWLIGEANAGVMVVVFTRRNEGKMMRIISARPAGRREKKRYEAYKRISI